MTHYRSITALLRVLTLPAFMLFGAVNTVEAGEGHDHDSHEDRVNITADIAAQAGISSAAVGPANIRQTITVYGKTVADPASVSHIRARFPGSITKVPVTIGDTVTAGAALAEIEANESLRRYTLTSPLNGVIISRNANPGELAQDQVLLTVANYDLIWVELQIFPSQIPHVAAGQAVTVFSDPVQSDATIKHLLASEDGQPFMRARVALDNTDRQWTPGLLLAGSIVTSTLQVPMAVDNRALHLFEGHQVVFVHAGNSYEARPVELGPGDQQFTQVIAGLHAGERYVVNNSYLIKADLEKSSASHHH